MSAKKFTERTADGLLTDIDCCCEITEKNIQRLAKKVRKYTLRLEDEENELQRLVRVRDSLLAIHPKPSQD